MSDEYGFSTLQMGVRRHHQLLRTISERYQGVSPSAQRSNGPIDRIPDVQPHVGRDLLVSAATSMQFKSKVTYLPSQFKLDEVMDIFSVGRRSKQRRSRFSCQGAYATETRK